MRVQYIIGTFLKDLAFFQNGTTAVDTRLDTIKLDEYVWNMIFEQRYTQGLNYQKQNIRAEKILSNETDEILK